MSGKGFTAGFIWRSRGWAEWRDLPNTGLPAGRNVGQEARGVLGLGTFSRLQGWEGHLESSRTGLKGRGSRHLGKVWGQGEMNRAIPEKLLLAKPRPILAERWRPHPGGFEQSDPYCLGMTPEIGSNMIRLSEMVLEKAITHLTGFFPNGFFVVVVFLLLS